MELIQNNPNAGQVDSDGVDRRGFLKCMQWAGTGVVWSFAANVPVSEVLEAAKKKAEKASGFTFVQISNTHMGFNRPANTDVAGTVLNGHNYTALSTAFPQPAPGSAPSAGPMTVPANKLRQVLGISEMNFVVNRHPLAVVNSRLESPSVE